MINTCCAQNYALASSAVISFLWHLYLVFQWIAFLSRSVLDSAPQRRYEIVHIKLQKKVSLRIHIKSISCTWTALPYHITRMNLASSDRRSRTLNYNSFLCVKCWNALKLLWNYSKYFFPPFLCVRDFFSLVFNYLIYSFHTNFFFSSSESKNCFFFLFFSNLMILWRVWGASLGSAWIFFVCPFESRFFHRHNYHNWKLLAFLLRIDFSNVKRGQFWILSSSAQLSLTVFYFLLIRPAVDGLRRNEIWAHTNTEADDLRDAVRRRRRRRRREKQKQTSNQRCKL